MLAGGGVLNATEGSRIMEGRERGEATGTKRRPGFISLALLNDEAEQKGVR